MGGGVGGDKRQFEREASGAGGQTTGYQGLFQYIDDISFSPKAGKAHILQ